MTSRYSNYILAVNATKVWTNNQKPWVLAWAIWEQGENRFAVNGMGELARYADNYHSLHQRPEMAVHYPCVYHLMNTNEVDNNYVDFASPQEEIEGLMRFLERYPYKGFKDHMNTFEELLRFITPAFCPTPGYVERVLSFIPEAEAELRKVGWKPDDENHVPNPIPQPTLGYNIRNGLLYIDDDPVPYFETPNKDKYIKNDPVSIVLHYTASLGFQGNINWFMNPKNQVSAHLLIGQTGIIAQFVPFHIPAWHSGTTYYNRHSIGIELEGLGCSKIRIGNNVVFPKWGGTKLVPVSDCVYAPHPKEPKNWRYWPKFTNAQYDALNRVIPVLNATYGVLGILEHWEIMPGKLDVGPGFDRNRIGA
jgi:N-acetylmuramoyl-L-alanine amidase